MNELAKQLEEVAKQDCFSQEEKEKIKETINLLRSKSNGNLMEWMGFVQRIKKIKKEIEKEMNDVRFECVDFEYNSERLHTYKIDLKKEHYRCWMFEMSYFEGREKPFLFSTVLSDDEVETANISEMEEKVLSYIGSEEMKKFFEDIKKMV